MSVKGSETVRKMLADGKVTMPAPWRKKNHIEEGDALIVEENGFGVVTVRKAEVKAA